MKLESVRIRSCQNLKVLESEFVRIKKKLERVRTFKILNASESESVRIFYNWKVSELTKTGLCQNCLLYTSDAADDPYV